MRTAKVVPFIAILACVAVCGCENKAPDTTPALPATQEPDVAVLIRQIQTAIRTGQALSASTLCHYVYPPRTSDIDPYVSRFLSMDASKVYHYKYTPEDGRADISLVDTNPKVLVNLHLAVKNGACESFQMAEVVQ
jgi:hypothetical protein